MMPLHHCPPSDRITTELLLAGAINGFCNKRYDEDGRAKTPLRLASKRLLFGSSLKNGLRRFSHSCLSARRGAPLYRDFRIHPALIGIFFAVDRRNVRWVLIKIGSPDPKFLAVGINPLPHAFA